jgi:hypothetical protein
VRPQLPWPLLVKILVALLKDPDIVDRVARGPKASRGGFFSIFFDRSLDHRLMPLRPTQFLRHQLVSTTVLSPPNMTDLALAHKRRATGWPQFFSRAIRTTRRTASVDAATNISPQR